MATNELSTNGAATLNEKAASQANGTESPVRMGFDSQPQKMPPHNDQNEAPTGDDQSVANNVDGAHDPHFLMRGGPPNAARGPPPFMNRPRGMPPNGAPPMYNSPGGPPRGPMRGPPPGWRGPPPGPNWGGPPGFRGPGPMGGPGGGPSPYGSGGAGPAPSPLIGNAPPQSHAQQPPNQHEMLKQVLGIPPHEQLWVETKAGDGDKVYYYNATTRETTWKRPTENCRIMTQQQIEEQVAMSSQKTQGGPGYGQPPYGAQGAYGGGQQPVQASSTPWIEYTADDGRKYYYNSVTNETTWDRPAEFQPAPQPTPAQTSVPGYLAQPGSAQQPKQTVATSRPVSSTPVQGTPWCVVWTGDNRVFFYNPSTRTSVWERPPDLYGRQDVDALIRQPPIIGQGNTTAAGETMGGAAGVQKQGGSQADSTEYSEDEQPKLTKKQLKELKRKEYEEKKKAEEKAKKEAEKAAESSETKKSEANAAIEAEIKAQQARASIPLENRITSFKEMLAEKKVSAFSTWEKELSKIVFDERYLLLSSKERKQAFDEWTKERAEIERAERKERAKEARSGFKALLAEAQLSSKSSYKDFDRKHGKDARFKAVEKERERQNMFDDYIDSLREKERKEKAERREKQKEAYIAMLKECDWLHRSSRWSESKRKLESHDAYKACESSTAREDWFREYVRTLSEKEEDKDEKKKKKRKHSSKSRSPSPSEKRRRHDSDNKDTDELMEGATTPPDEKDLDPEEKARRKKEREALAERERQVAAEKKSNDAARNTEAERIKIAEAEDTYRQMLIDHVKQCDLAFKDGRKAIRKDERYEPCADVLDKDAKVRIFEEHMRTLSKKRFDQLVAILSAMSIDLHARWSDVKRQVRDDENVKKLYANEKSQQQLERDFREFMEGRVQMAKNEFRNLLRETKLITHKSKALIAENSQHLADILTVLENDSRYLALDNMPKERERLLELHLDDLARAGTPPPPTATEPDRPERRSALHRPGPDDSVPKPALES